MLDVKETNELISRAKSGDNAAKEKGKVRSEGKDYVIKDGDVVLFRFNV